MVNIFAPPPKINLLLLSNIGHSDFAKIVYIKSAVWYNKTK